MIERPAAGERAVIVQLDFGVDDLAEQVEEVTLLAESAGASVFTVVHGRRQSPDPATYAGKGKVEEIAAQVAAHDADLVIFNHELSNLLILAEISGNSLHLEAIPLAWAIGTVDGGVGCRGT